MPLAASKKWPFCGGQKRYFYRREAFSFSVITNHTTTRFLCLINVVFLERKNGLKSLPNFPSAAWNRPS